MTRRGASPPFRRRSRQSRGRRPSATASRLPPPKTIAPTRSQAGGQAGPWIRPRPHRAGRRTGRRGADRSPPARRCPKASAPVTCNGPAPPGRRPRGPGHRPSGGNPGARRRRSTRRRPRLPRGLRRAASRLGRHGSRDRAPPARLPPAAAPVNDRGGEAGPPLSRGRAEVGRERGPLPLLEAHRGPEPCGRLSPRPGRIPGPVPGGDRAPGPDGPDSCRGPAAHDPGSRPPCNGSVSGGQPGPTSIGEKR